MNPEELEAAVSTLADVISKLQNHVLHLQGAFKSHLADHTDEVGRAKTDEPIRPKHSLS